MRSGDLRKRVTFQVRSTVSDAFGQQSSVWTDLFTIWAGIEGLSARELYAAQAVQSEVTHTIMVRYRPEFALPAVVAAMRVLYGARVFNISGAVNVNERNREIVISASEGLNLG